MKGDFYWYKTLISKNFENSNFNIKPLEGLSVLNEGIKFFEEAEPLQEELIFDQKLCKIAQRHAEDLSKNGLISHTSTYNLTPC